jgi:hypothetical protein
MTNAGALGGVALVVPFGDWAVVVAFLDRLPSLKAPEAPGGSRASLVGQHVVVVLDDIRVLRRVDQRVVLIGRLPVVFTPAEPAGSLEVHLRPLPGAAQREQALRGRLKEVANGDPRETLTAVKAGSV